MSKEATDRYSVKVEIPITVILETIFSTDNNDIETLCRYARKYGFVDFDEKEKVYKLQKDYNKQDFYVWLSKEERKQYDYESTLLNRIDKAIDILDNSSHYLKVCIDNDLTPMQLASKTLRGEDNE